MDQSCALMVKVVNCIGCWKKTVKIVFVTQRSDYTTQTEEETHSVLVLVEGPASDWSSVKTTLLHTQYPVGLCVLVNTNLSERGICRKARRKFLTPGCYALREGCRHNLISQKTSVTDDTDDSLSISYQDRFQPNKHQRCHKNSDLISSPNQT